MFCEKSDLKNLAELTRKSLFQSLFLIKLQFKKSLWHRFFPCEYSEVFKNTFCIEYLRWLPLLNLEPSLWNLQSFSSSYFWLHLISWAPSTSWHLNEDKNSLQWYVLNRRSLRAFTEWWCFEIVFTMIWVLRTCLYLAFIRRK